MATSNKPKKQTVESTLPSWFNEVMGISMCGMGVLLFLALISFTPVDLPDFVRSVDRPEGVGVSNWIGVIGALLAWCVFMIFGVAAYLVPIALIWLGFAYAVMESSWTCRKWIGMLAFVITGACLLGVQDWFFKDWAVNLDLKVTKDGVSNHLTGGYVGYFIGRCLLVTLLAKPGAMLVLFFAYLVGMILITGVHPVKFIKAVVSILATKFSNWRSNSKEAREKKRISDEKQAEKDRLRDERKAERDAERRAAEVMKKSKEKDTEEAELPLDIPDNPMTAKLMNRELESKKKTAKGDAKPEPLSAASSTPEPQIIDSSQNKLKKEIEPGSRPFNKKKSDNPALSVEGYEDYETPGFDLLSYDEESEEVAGESEADKGELIRVQKVIVDTLQAFGVEVTAGDITRGPTITRYEVYPSLGLRVSRITQLEADLARATRAERINILAPIPGKDTVGIEIANDDRVAVPLRELLQDEAFTSAKKKIPLALGKDVYGNAVIGDLAAMPHLLVAGATGAGKSVCINSIITSILFKFSPDELRFIMVDPKVVEMQIYGDLPHLVIPVVTEPAKVVSALRWVVNEMEKRYRIFAKCGVRNFDGFNGRPRPEKEEEEEPEIIEEEEGEDAEHEVEEVDQEHIDSIARALEDGDLGPSSLSDEDEDELEAEEDIPDRIPYIVVIIDELADLMQTAPADVEGNIARIAQKARAAGIHLIIATQTPRADVVTGIIKANIPSRIAFQVSSALDSRVILDGKGAEKLVGKGDMLYLPPGSAKLERSQGAFVSDEEVEAIVDYCSNQCEQKFEEDVQKSIESGGGDQGDGDNDGVSDADEECYEKCMEVIRAEGKASTSLLQRRLRLGYTRAARMMDILEDRGIIGPADGAKAREIRIPTDVD